MSAVRLANPVYMLRVTPRSPGQHDNIIISLGGVKNYKFQEGNDLIFAYTSHDVATTAKQKLNSLKYVKSANMVKKNPRHRKKKKITSLRGIAKNPRIGQVNLDALDKNVSALNRTARLISQHAFDKDENPIAHFPRTKRGRPRKVTGPGRPRKFKKAGHDIFNVPRNLSGHLDVQFPRQKTRRTSKKRGRPIKNDWWILDCYVKGILIATYIGDGAKSTAMREASEMLNKPLETYGKVIDSVGIIDKVELAGPYPREDGKPTPAWPRL